ncbi:MAG: phenylalanine--tRNA ligase subunit beta [bacterium]|nr:phenylalanine--tRNA ligase subunit beta [bacterium]
MNIKITYNWLLEYLETDTDPYEIQKYLSLCGPSVERIEKVGDDFVFDIEITSNRVDSASVFGIAQEAQAILPRFGKKATLKFNPLTQYTFSSIVPTGEKPLKVQILQPGLCSRFTSVVIENVKIQPSPEQIKNRLSMCDVQSINNVVDISNYLMLSLGQPTHVFDYDKIARHTMIMRESKKGEELVTLDGKKIKLPGEDIVIEDGDGKLIDLCGIMGGFNSSVQKDTKNVLLFVQTYNKRKIRRTSMTTGQRSVAATYFEKGLDEERVEPTLVMGIELLQKYAGGTVGSQVTDMYPHPHTPKEIGVSLDQVKKIMGVNVTTQDCKNILSHLGFEVEASENMIKVTIPTWRSQDIEIPQDIIEEIARVYGYHKLPNTIQPTVYVPQPKEVELFFQVQSKVKQYLKHIGLHEVMNYSLVSKKLLESFNLPFDEHLRISNTISEEIEYLRSSLLPSLVKNMQDNQGKGDELKFFEIAKVYKIRKGDLPEETYKLSLAIDTDFFDLKGIIEALMKELHIEKYSVNKSHGSDEYSYISPSSKSVLKIQETALGQLGELALEVKDKMSIKKNVYLAEIDFMSLALNYRLINSYTPPNPYAVIKLDLTIEQNEKMTYEDIKKRAMTESKFLQGVEVVSMYKNNISLRFYFSSTERNITEEDAKKELEEIKKKIG